MKSTLSRDKVLTNLLFFTILCYIFSPWFFEKKLFFNELISISGLLVFSLNFKDIIYSNKHRLILAFTGLGIIHLISSLFLTDNWYCYFRNSVIIYSSFAYFIGYFFLEEIVKFLKQFQLYITLYIGIMLLFPISKIFFERIGISVLFPLLSLYSKKKYSRIVILFLLGIYWINYESSTTLILALTYLCIWISPSYSFFKYSVISILAAAVILFLYASPVLTIDPAIYVHNDATAIYRIINSHPLLAIDPNTTWRLVLWKQLVVDNFPENIIGIGFGTPALKYFPIEDLTKIPILPYVLGGHNSFIYLFARMGVLYLLITAIMYHSIIKDFFKFNEYYVRKNFDLIIYSFVSITIMAIFNPVLESPLFASTYWLILGMVFKTMDLRKSTPSPHFEG